MYTLINGHSCSIKRTELDAHNAAQFTLTYPANEFAKLVKRGQLGLFYGVDVSNVIGRLFPDVRAWAPTVDDTARSRKGIKTVTLTYELRNQK
jgi:hypothetical protein